MTKNQRNLITDEDQLEKEQEEEAGEITSTTNQVFF
jgi:hypothetical protein